MLVPRLEIRELILALAPCVKVRAAITAATPINIPSPVSKERRRLAQSASKALLKLAPMALLRLILCPRFGKRAFGLVLGLTEGREGGAGRAGVFASFPGFLERVELPMLALLRNLYFAQIWCVCPITPSILLAPSVGQAQAHRAGYDHREM